MAATASLDPLPVTPILFFSMENTAIALHDVSHLYSGAAVLRRISGTLDPARCYLLLGPNGAGKTTLLRILAGLLQPSYGTVRLFGQEPADVRGRVGFMTHAPMLYDDYTGLENLRYTRETYRGVPCMEPAEALLAVGLDPALKRPLRTYSQGMRQRVSLARVLLPRPDLLLLDEPFSNMDAMSARAMLERLVQERTRGCTIVLTTHQRELAEPLADTILTLHEGALTQQQREGAPA